MVVAVGAAAIVTFVVQETTYRAEMKLVVSQGGSVLPPGGGDNEPLTQTMSSLLESDVVASAVIENLGLDTSSQQLLDRLDVTTEPQSAVLIVGYESTRPEKAVAVLEEVGAEFPTIVSESLGDEATFRGDGSLELSASVFDPPTALSEPVSPSPVRNLVIAGLAGLLAGLLAVVMLQALEPPRTSPYSRQSSSV